MSAAVNRAPPARWMEDVDVVDLTGLESDDEPVTSKPPATHNHAQLPHHQTARSPPHSLYIPFSSLSPLHPPTASPHWSVSPASTKSSSPYLSSSPRRPSTMHYPVAASPPNPLASNRPSPFNNGTYPPDSLPAFAPSTPQQRHHTQPSAQPPTYSHAATHAPAAAATTPSQSMYAAPASRLANIATKAASFVSSWVNSASSSTAATAANAPATAAPATATAPQLTPPIRPAASRAPRGFVPYVPAVVATATTTHAMHGAAVFPRPPEGYFPDWGDTTMAAFKAVKAFHKKQLRRTQPNDHESPHTAATAHATSLSSHSTNTTAFPSSSSSSSSSSSASSAAAFSSSVAHPRPPLLQSPKRQAHRTSLSEESSGSSEASDDASDQSESGESLFGLSPDDNDPQEEMEDEDGRLGNDSEVDGSGRHKDEEVLYVSQSENGAEYRRAPRRARLFRSASRSSRSASHSPSQSSSPLRSPSPPPHPLSSYRRCMTCLERLSKLHFTREQWALAKEYSQCKECQSAAEGRRRQRRKDRKRRDRGGRRLDDTHDGEEGEDAQHIDAGPRRERGTTRAAWLASRLERLYREDEEEEEVLQRQRDEIMLDDDDDVHEIRAVTHRKDRVEFTAARDEKDDEQQLHQKSKLGRGRQRRARPTAADADDGAQTEVEDAAVATRKRRRRRDSDGDEARKSAKKKRKYNLAPEINPYNRNFTAQQHITNSRSGRLGASADTNTPPPSPLQPDVIAFLRSAFGLDSVDHKSSTQVSAVYAKYMEQTGTLGNGKVYVAVSSVNSLDGSVGSSDEGAGSVRRTRQRQKQEIAQKGKSGSDQWQPMLGLFAGRDIEKDEVVTTYGGVLVDGDDARRRHASTYTHIRRIRDSRMVRDGRLFSALFDRSQVDMYDQFTMDKKRKSRKRLLPACGAEHIVTALSMEGHEDEMRVGLVLLDALQGEKGALYGQRMEPKDRQQLLASIMAHIGDQSTVISGEALKQIDGKRFLSRVRGPALIINEPSATFYSSSPNPYSSRSGTKSTEGEQVFRDKSLDISYLFPFQLRPALLPALVLHPLPEQRHKALRELSQNISDPAGQLLTTTCYNVHELLHTSGMGFMANTGSKRECNVRVIEVNPRRDGLAPNEIFYVSCRKILKGEEILAPYNNNESKSKRMARMKGKQKAEEEEEEEADGQEAGERAVQSKVDNKAKGSGKEEEKSRYAGLTGTQKARMKRREAIERKQKKRELLRLRALQRSAREKGEVADTAEPAEEGEEEDGEEDEEEEVEMEKRQSREEAPNECTRQTRSRGAEVAAERSAGRADECDSPPPDVMELSSPASSSPSPSPSCSVSPSPASTSPAVSFSPVPPLSPPPAAGNKSAAHSNAAYDRRQESVTSAKAREKRAAAAMEVIDVEAEAESCQGDADGRHIASGEVSVRKGYSILKRQDSPWMPPVIYEQRTRARSAFGGEVQQPSEAGIVVSFQQMNKQQIAHEFERKQRWKIEKK